MIPRKRWAYVIPVTVVMYTLAYGAKGLASGIFFIGYLVLQIPAAVPAAKWSAVLAFFGLKPVTVEESAHVPAATRHP